MDKLKMTTANGVQGNIEKIAQLFPSCVTETRDERTGELRRKVDFEKLQQELSDSIVSEREERYQFTWPDKSKAILLANSPINATLRPCRDESVDFDTTQNLYIEGDNLDVLKCLKETYLHKVKMIYIDPPYNTGNDFVYEDDFAESADEYRERSGQYDEQGNRLVTNTESNGRFHTDWLNMIYPRLKVARDLLTDDGVIFISIDDNEVENLKKVCNEVFGEENFVGTLIWKSRQNKDNRNKTGLSIDHEYIICYSKTLNVRVFKGAERLIGQYKNPDNDPRGVWTSGNMVGLLGENLRPNCHYDLIDPNTGINYGKPKLGWRYDRNTMKRLIEENRILWPETPNGRPRRKVFLSELNADLPNYTSIVGENTFTRTGTTDLNKLFENKFFDFPKPVILLEDFIKQTSNKDSIILDFFSGSATTAHAVMQLNAEDGGNRKFIMVQLPELTDEKSEAYKAGYKNICEIGKERIRRAGKKIKDDLLKKQVHETATVGTRFAFDDDVDKPHDQWDYLNSMEERAEAKKEEERLGDIIKNLDTGFRVLKLDSTNMENIYYSPSDISQADLFSMVDNVKSDRTAEDLLFQVMLELGATLDSKIEHSEVDGKTVWNVADGYLMACFDKDVTDEVVKTIAKAQPQYAVLRDTSMATDSTATNFEQIFKTYSPNTTTKII